MGGVMCMPRVVETVKTICGREPSKGVNRDEAVAIGASDVLAGNVTDILSSTTPLSLGMSSQFFGITNLAASERTNSAKKTRLFSLFLLWNTLYIDVEAHFMRLVMPLWDCADVRARTTHL